MGRLASLLLSYSQLETLGKHFGATPLDPIAADTSRKHRKMSVQRTTRVAGQLAQRLACKSHTTCPCPRSAQQIRRVISTAPRYSTPIPPTLHSKSNIFPRLPAFAARGKDAEVLYDPKEFYSYLLKGIKRAKKRICLAALYIGKEESELVESLASALRANPSLELHIMVDFLRSTRESPERASSAHLLNRLHDDFPKQVRISLYHTPALSGLLKKVVPKRYNEGFGLWHGKVYGFDDDIVISGANLSRDYFTNRQDRYISILNHPPLADYFHLLLDRISRLTYQLRGWSYAASSAANPFDIRWIDPAGTAAEPTVHPGEFTVLVKEMLLDHIDGYLAKPSAELASPIGTSSDDAHDTILQPFLQMGPFDIRQETDYVVPTLLEQAGQSPSTAVDWTSGYFSLRTPYREALLKCQGPVSITCAAPEANGFYQSAGFSRYLPPAYTYLERQFYEDVKRRSKESDVAVHEWKKQGWTYHAKGMGDTANFIG